MKKQTNSDKQTTEEVEVPPLHCFTLPQACEDRLVVELPHHSSTSGRSSLDTSVGRRLDSADSTDRLTPTHMHVSSHDSGSPITGHEFGELGPELQPPDMARLWLGEIGGAYGSHDLVRIFTLKAEPNILEILINNSFTTVFFKFFFIQFLITLQYI